MKIVGYKEKKGNYNGKPYHTLTLYVVKHCTTNEEYGDVDVKGLECFKAKISNVDDRMLEKVHTAFKNKDEVSISVNKYGYVVLFE